MNTLSAMQFDLSGSDLSITLSGVSELVGSRRDRSKFGSFFSWSGVREHVAEPSVLIFGSSDSFRTAPFKRLNRIH